MARFRIFLAAIFGVIVAYTLVVIAREGLGLFGVFFGDIAAMRWPGQFNLDFLGFLLLSGFWLAWRNHFSPAGLLLGICGVFLGAPFLTAYLFVISRASGDDIRVVLLGSQRALGSSAA